MEVLRDEYISIMESENDVKDDVCLKSLDYYILRFGYLLIKINCPKIL